VRYLLTILLLLLSTTTYATPLDPTFYKRYLELSYGAPSHIDFVDWLAFVKKRSLERGISPYRTLAVLETESSKHGRCLTFGPINRNGKFVGPGGLNKNCGSKEWQQKILNPYFNTEVSIKAMTRYGDFRRSMKKYNTSFNGAYWNRIRSLEYRNREARIFENLDLVKVYKPKTK
jgi:hypothetical protein